MPLPAQAQPGDALAFNVRRGNELVRCMVQAGSSPDSQAPDPAPRAPSYTAPPAQASAAHAAPPYVPPTAQPVAQNYSPYDAHRPPQATDMAPSYLSNISGASSSIGTTDSQGRRILSVTERTYFVDGMPPPLPCRPLHVLPSRSHGSVVIASDA